MNVLGRVLFIALALAALAIGATFSYFNPQDVSVDWLYSQGSAPLGLLLLGAMLAGFVLAMVLLIPLWWMQRIRVHRLQRTVLRQSGELDSLRGLQIEQS
nr:DUF1049 domain-containing protein [Oceanococcus sp. HetDA_MAG_MS8]